MCKTHKDPFSDTGAYSRRALSRELENSVARVEETHADYRKACEDLWDTLWYRIPHLETVLKIGKIGFKERLPQ